jgi:hypothetical protein
MANPSSGGARPTKATPKSTPKPLTGPAAIAELQRQVSPKGVAQAEKKAEKAIYERYGFTPTPVRTTAGVKKK